MPGVLSVGGLTKAKAGSERSSTEGIAIDITAPAEDLFGSCIEGGSREEIRQDVKVKEYRMQGEFGAKKFIKP
jgi:hypothetical protein